MAEFFHMGGYGFFIWVSYATVATLFLYHYFSPLVRHNSLRQSLIDQSEPVPSDGYQDAS